jgi:hypothetical protein
MVTKGEHRYELLSRPPLTVEIALAAISKACGSARKVKQAEQALGEFELVIAGLLPSQAHQAPRETREHWVPEHRAEVDEWIRLAIYLGALDGWRHMQRHVHPQPPNRAAMLAYCSSYSMAFAAVGR